MANNEAEQDWTTSSLAEAAEVDQSRIRQLLLSGKIEGRKHGRDWVIPFEEGRRWLDRRRKKEAPP